MHIGHNHEELENIDLAIRHFGVGVIKEQEGRLEEALNEYELALALDPELHEAGLKIVRLMQRLKLTF